MRLGVQKGDYGVLLGPDVGRSSNLCIIPALGEGKCLPSAVYQAFLKE